MSAAESFVYVYVPEFAGDELYVFDTAEAAATFEESRGYEPGERVREEPILDIQFARKARDDLAAGYGA